MQPAESTSDTTIILRPEQAHAAAMLGEQLKKAQAALNGYLTGLLHEHGIAEGKWGFSTDLTSIVKVPE